MVFKRDQVKFCKHKRDTRSDFFVIHMTQLLLTNGSFLSDICISGIFLVVCLCSSVVALSQYSNATTTLFWLAISPVGQGEKGGVSECNFIDEMYVATIGWLNRKSTKPELWLDD